MMTHKYVAGRHTPDGYLVVTAGLNCYEGQRPYFSVTAELWQSKGWYENGQDGRMSACGQLVEEVSRAFPSLRPILALHLSDDIGTPMHAVENGRYWIEQGEFEIAARHFRCSTNDLPAGEDVEAWVETQRERWEDEAADAIEALDRLQEPEITPVG